MFQWLFRTRTSSNDSVDSGSDDFRLKEHQEKVIPESPPKATLTQLIREACLREHSLKVSRHKIEYSKRIYATQVTLWNQRNNDTLLQEPPTSTFHESEIILEDPLEDHDEILDPLLLQDCLQALQSYLNQHDIIFHQLSVDEKTNDPMLAFVSKLKDPEEWKLLQRRLKDSKHLVRVTRPGLADVWVAGPHRHDSDVPTRVALWELQQHEIKLDRSIEDCHERILKHKKLALQSKKTNLKRAKREIMSVKLYEQQIESLMTKRLNVQSAILTLENAAETPALLSTLQSTTKILRQLREAGPDVDDVFDDLQEEHDLHQEIQDKFAAMNTSSSPIDENELEKELEALMIESTSGGASVEEYRVKQTKIEEAKSRPEKATEAVGAKDEKKDDSESKVAELVADAFIPKVGLRSPRIRMKSTNDNNSARPTAEFLASAVPGPPLETKPDYQNMVGPLGRLADTIFMVAFRIQLAKQVGKDSPKALTDYSAIIDLANKLNRQEYPQLKALQVMKNLFPSWLPGAYAKLFSGPFPQFSARMNAWATKVAGYWLMGECEVNDTIIDDGSLAKGQGLLVKRCRFLEEAGCASVCVNSCKLPTQAFFMDEMGLPLTMEPNYETYECQFRFGKTPDEETENAALSTPCLSRCPTAGGLRSKHNTMNASGTCSLVDSPTGPF